MHGARRERGPPGEGSPAPPPAEDGYLLEIKFDAEGPTRWRLGYPPWAGATASQRHEKTCLFDDQVYMVGSMNLTLNSSKECMESGVFLRSVECVEAGHRHFEYLWNTAFDISPALLLPMTPAEAAAAKKRHGGK